LKCEPPNNAIYKFEGTCKVAQCEEEIPLGADNVLLRGSRLRNTEWIIGVVVYQGHDSKIMMNSAKAKYKFSKLEKSMNKTIIVTFVLQFLLALIGALTGSI